MIKNNLLFLLLIIMIFSGFSSCGFFSKKHSDDDEANPPHIPVGENTPVSGPNKSGAGNERAQQAQDQFTQLINSKYPQILKSFEIAKQRQEKNKSLRKYTSHVSSQPLAELVSGSHDSYIPSAGGAQENTQQSKDLIAVDCLFDHVGLALGAPSNGFTIEKSHNIDVKGYALPPNDTQTCHLLIDTQLLNETAPTGKPIQLPYLSKNGTVFVPNGLCRFVDGKCQGNISETQLKDVNTLLVSLHVDKSFQLDAQEMAAITYTSLPYDARIGYTTPVGYHPGHNPALQSYVNSSLKAFMAEHPQATMYDYTQQTKIYDCDMKALAEAQRNSTQTNEDKIMIAIGNIPLQGQVIDIKMRNHAWNISLLKNAVGASDMTPPISYSLEEYFDEATARWLNATQAKVHSFQLEDLLEKNATDDGKTILQSDFWDAAKNSAPQPITNDVIPRTILTVSRGNPTTGINFFSRADFPAFQSNQQMSLGKVGSFNIGDGWLGENTGAAITAWKPIWRSFDLVTGDFISDIPRESNSNQYRTALAYCLKPEIADFNAKKQVGDVRATLLENLLGYENAYFIDASLDKVTVELRDEYVHKKILTFTLSRLDLLDKCRAAGAKITPKKLLNAVIVTE